MKFSKKIILYVSILLAYQVSIRPEFPEIEQLDQAPTDYTFEEAIFRENFLSTKEIDNTEQLPIVVIVCSYNNAKWAVRNLSSVFAQKYNNFRVIYVDDASSDGTPDIVQEYINKYNLQDKITLIRNSFRGRKLKNMYKSYRTCQDNEIIVQVDGDDWLAHQNVLAFINMQFKKNIWLTYGTHKNYPPSTINVGAKSRHTPLHTIQSRTFRNDFFYMPLRTFYAWLFKQIKLEDMIASHSYDVPQFRGKFYPASNDAVIMWAMLEMARTKFKYIPQVLYIANRGNPIIGLKVDRSLQKATAKDIRTIVPLYPVIQKPISIDTDKLKSLQATGIILSRNNNPDSLEKVIEATKAHIKDVNHLIVLYHEENVSPKYQALQKKYHAIQFINIAKIDFAQFINKIRSLPNLHLLLLDDTAIVSRALLCNPCIQELEKTSAYAFYYNLSDKIMTAKKIPYEHIVDNLYVWKFGCDDKKQIQVHNFDGMLLRKENMVTELKHINQTSTKKLLEEWLTSPISPKKVGLFFGTYIN